MKKIEELIIYLDNFPKDMWENNPALKPINSIGYYERKIGYIFPDDFRYFISEYYGLSIPFEIIYGTSEDEDIYSEYILETEKVGNSMPKYLVPFCPNGRGDHYCFNKNDNKIYFWQHDCEDVNFNPDFECENFSDWLKENLKNSFENL